jgi:hypothetical protein
VPETLLTSAYDSGSPSRSCTTQRPVPQPSNSENGHLQWVITTMQPLSQSDPFQCRCIFDGDSTPPPLTLRSSPGCLDTLISGCFEIGDSAQRRQSVAHADTVGRGGGTNDLEVTQVASQMTFTCVRRTYPAAVGGRRSASPAPLFGSPRPTRRSNARRTTHTIRRTLGRRVVLRIPRILRIGGDVSFRR